MPIKEASLCAFFRKKHRSFITSSFSSKAYYRIDCMQSLSGHKVDIDIRTKLLYWQIIISLSLQYTWYT
jgi:hypothetical protein